MPPALEDDPPRQKNGDDLAALRAGFRPQGGKRRWLKASVAMNALSDSRVSGLALSVAAAGSGVRLRNPHRPHRFRNRACCLPAANASQISSPADASF